ncbi:MAG: CBS domain-containing protein [Phycisphaerae bacterium]
MPTVQHILTHKGGEVVRIDQDSSVLDAARLMNERHIGAVVVTRAEKVVGIFTERDILNRVVARERNPAQTRVEEVMTAPVACCDPGTTRAECRAVMKNRRIRHLPVVAEGRLLGIVSIGDILENEGFEQQETIRYLYEYMHGEYR